MPLGVEVKNMGKHYMRSVDLRTKEPKQGRVLKHYVDLLTSTLSVFTVLKNKGMFTE